MDNPYSPAVGKRGQSPPIKNSFQRELEAKMRDRHARGLSTGISDDELDSEDGGYYFDLLFLVSNIPSLL